MTKRRMAWSIAALAMFFVGYAGSAALATEGFVPGAGEGGGCMRMYTWADNNGGATPYEMGAFTEAYNNSICSVSAYSAGDTVRVDAVGWRDLNGDWSPDAWCVGGSDQQSGTARAPIWDASIPPWNPANGCGGSGWYATSSAHSMWRSGWQTSSSQGSGWIYYS